MKTNVALAIATVTLSCSAFAAAPAAAATWSGQHHTKSQANKLAKAQAKTKQWTNKPGTKPVLNKKDIAAEIGANEHHARKAMREGSMQDVQGMHVSGMPS